MKDIRRATRKQYSAEEKIRIVLDGLRGEHSIAELCRREGIAESLYYTWSKEFLEAGKRRLAGDTERAATSGEVKDLRREARALKEVVAEQALELRLLKKEHDRGCGKRGMRYPACEKLEIIRLVEQSHLPVRRTLEKLGVSRHLLQMVRPLSDRRAGISGRQIAQAGARPTTVRGQIMQLALDEPEAFRIREARGPGLQPRWRLSSQGNEEDQLQGVPVPSRNQAIWLYVRFTLSFRDVEDLLPTVGSWFPTRPSGAG